MVTSPIVARLAAGENLLLDGGTGSELQRRGVDVSRRTADGGIGAWSATANVDAPDVVRAVHEAYLRAGADIITTNSFWSNRTRLARLGQADRMEEYTRVSVELAREAVDDTGFGAYVAGSMAPPDGRPKPGNIAVSSDDLAGEFRDQAAVLAEAGADLILLEYVSSSEEATTLVRRRRRDRAPCLSRTQALRRSRHVGLQRGCRRRRPGRRGPASSRGPGHVQPSGGDHRLPPPSAPGIRGHDRGLRQHRLHPGPEGPQRRHSPMAPYRRGRQHPRPVRGIRPRLAHGRRPGYWRLLRLKSRAHRRPTTSDTLIPRPTPAPYEGEEAPATLTSG